MRWRKLLRSIILYAFIIFCKQGLAQTNIDAATQFIGTWKGTSICQIKNFPCHDETVVYHITKQKDSDSLEIQANKIINGAEEEMGLLIFSIDKSGKEITSMPKPGNIWNFKLTGKKMSGTLYNQNKLYRIIEVDKID